MISITTLGSSREGVRQPGCWFKAVAGVPRIIRLACRPSKTRDMECIQTTNEVAKLRPHCIYTRPHSTDLN